MNLKVLAKRELMQRIRNGLREALKSAPKHYRDVKREKQRRQDEQADTARP